MPPYGKVRLRAAKVVTQTNVQKKKNKNLTGLRMLRTICKSLERILVIGVSEVLPFFLFLHFLERKKDKLPLILNPKTLKL